MGRDDCFLVETFLLPGHNVFTHKVLMWGDETSVRAYVDQYSHRADQPNGVLSICFAEEKYKPKVVLEKICK